jgi:hypothetical protein
MERVGRQKIANWDEKCRSFPKDSIVEPFVNEEGLLDIRKSNNTLRDFDEKNPNHERPYQDDPFFDMFTDEQMRQASELLMDENTFVNWSGVPMDGAKFAFIKALKLVNNPPDTLIGRIIAGYDWD